MRTLPCGDAALLVETDGLPEVLALADAIRAKQSPWVLDVVPAARTVLVITVPGTDLAALRRTVLELTVDASAEPPDGETVEIPVVYDGPDLAEVAQLAGLSEDEVVAAHTGTPWRAAFGGFAPGFAYLVSGDERLRVPRRDEPRTSVPAGSVGLAGEFSGVYPRSSPGGWQLIGHTDAVLWDADREPAALLQPGGRVRFVVADRAAEEPRSTDADKPTPAVVRGLEVLATGSLALVQDLGRPGIAASGVARSGAADRGALRLANRLVANAEGAAGIECVFGGLAVRALSALTVAVTGAPAPADVDGTPMGHNAVLALRPGQVLTLGGPASGLRTYLAVRGGVDIAPVLGSRATDLLSGTGPPQLAAGDLIPTGPEPPTIPLVDLAPVAPPPAGEVTLRAVLGPRANWITDPARLAHIAWTASSRSNRIGIRLDGGTLGRADDTELPSEGVARGAIQVPPGGEPVLFLADHPVTGGYPVVAVVLDADVDRAAQVRPGQCVRFTLAPPAWKDGL